MVCAAIIRMITQLEVMSMVAGELSKRDHLTSSIATIVVTSGKNEAGKVEYVKKSQDGSDPSFTAIIGSVGLVSSKETRTARQDRRPRKNRSRQGATLASNSNWCTLSEESEMSKPSIRSQNLSLSKRKRGNFPVLRAIRPVLDMFCRSNGLSSVPTKKEVSALR